jgi:uncharacterized membrane protein HdeD (DUF308 family)
MKPLTYFRLALLFPYVLWGICAIIFLLVSNLEIPENWNIVLMPLLFYVFGIILWFVPYTALAIGLWLWSRNKSTKPLSKSALLAPILLAILVSLEAILVTLPADSVSEFMADATSQSALVGVFSLIFGYLCVGIAAGVYKFLRSRHLIAEESPAQTP